MADPKFDERVSKTDPEALSVIQAIDSCYIEARDAKWDREMKNKINRDSYLGRQNWDGKMEGQSTEFLPKVSIAVEQMSAFIKKGLTQFGSWFSVEVDNNVRPIISGQQIATILNVFLGNLWAGNNKLSNIQTVIGDGVKVGLLEAVPIFKVHGSMMPTRKFVAEPGEIELVDNRPQREKSLRIVEDEEWRLRIDLIRFEDYFPDPTGYGLYEIHECERDLHEVLAMAEDGIYDMAAVEELIAVDFSRAEDMERQPEAMNQNEPIKPQFRKRVVLREFWGTLLNSDGTVAHRNIVATVANEKFLIRPPEPNPFWHQQSPFVAEPLIRVPWSVWHKALYDEASSLNLAINEVFNLMIDGGIASVWGTRQIRLEDLEDPSQVGGGVPQGATLAVKPTLPVGGKVIERVIEGDVPQDAFAIFGALNQEFAQAVLTNEIKMGAIPKKEVRATEVIEASQSQAITLDGIVADLENNVINKLLEKAWLTVLQNADDFPQEVLLGQIDRRVGLILMRASPAERFALFAGMAKFNCFGLSATMAQAREFQKMMAIVQVILQNPLTLQAFMKRFSADKTIDSIFRMMNFNPEQIMKSQEEMTAEFQQAEAQGTLMAGQMMGRGGGGTPTGGASVPAQANQMANPLTGMTVNG